MPRASLYQPLTDFLAAHPAAEVTLTFAQLEALLGTSLPEQAWTQAWWRNEQTGAAPARAWLAAGWLVRWVRRTGDAAAVTFVRAPPGWTRPRPEPRRAD